VVTRFLSYHANYDPEQLEEEFPYWKRLHGFWRTLPNFNPFTASSQPGQNLAGEAKALLLSQQAPCVAYNGNGDDICATPSGGPSPVDLEDLPDVRNVRCSFFVFFSLDIFNSGRRTTIC